MASRDAYAFFMQDPVQERSLLLQVMANQNLYNQMQAGIAQEQVAAATNIAQNYPTAPGAVVAPLGMMLADPDDPAVQGVMQKVDEDNGGFVDWLGRTMGGAFMWGAEKLESFVADPIEDIARVTMLGWDTAWQELVARPYRTLVGTLQKSGINPSVLHTLPIFEGSMWDPQAYEGFSWDRLAKNLGNIGETHAQAGESAGLQALNAWRNGERVNLGTGILPVSELAEDTPEFQQLVEQGMDPEQARQQVQATLGRPLTHIADQQRESGILYNGLSVTPGRVVASQYLAPETEPFKLMSGLIDAGINIKGDPGAAGLKLASGARNARKVFNGAVPGLNRVIGPRADDWLRSRFPGRGQSVVRNIRDIDNYDAMQRLLPDVTDRGLLADLVEETDVNRITNRLRDEIQSNRNIRVVPRNRRIRNAARATAQQTRIGKLLDEMPGRTLNIDDLDEGIRTLDEFLVSAEFDAASRNNYMMRMARVANGDQAGAFAVYRDVMSDLGSRLVQELPDRLKKYAQPADLAKIETTITDVFKQMDEMRQYFNDVYGDPMYWPGAEVDHLARPFQTAHLMTEYLQRALPMPDPRMMRRVVSATHAEGRFLQRILHMGTPLDKLDAIERGAIITRGTDVAIGAVWKPIVLLRGAWTLRVIGEEQLRTAAHGFDSMFRHPIQYLGWVAEQQRLGGIIGGKGGKITVKRLVRNQAADTFDQFGNVVPGKVTYKSFDETVDVARGNKDVFGSMMSAETEHMAAMSVRHAGWLDTAPGDMFKGAWIPIRRHQPGFANGWVRSLSHIWNDEISTHVLQHGRKATVEWLEHGGGRPLLDKFIRSGGGEKKALLRTREGIEGYVDSVWARAHAYAGSKIDGPRTKDEWLGGKKFEIDLDGTSANQEILDLLATGEYNGRSLRGFETVDDWDKLVDELAPLQQYLPEDFITKSPLSSQPGGRPRENLWNKGTAYAFERFMTRPTNKLSRSPAFRQHYWKRMEELISYMDDEMADFAIKAAKDAGISPTALKRMAARRLDVNTRTAAQKGLDDLTFSTKGGTLNLEDVMGEADQVAKFFALHETEKLLYTLSKKHQINDILRNIIPFGEAWFEIMTTWGRLVTEHPQILRRGQQVIEGARESGYLEKDEFTGEDVFNFPGSGMMNKILFGEEAAEAGARVNPIGFVSGLNLAAGSYHPGLGPVVQVPSSWLLSKKESWDWFQKLANPFGVKDIDSPGDILNQALPAWAQKLFTAATGGSGTGDWERLQQSTAIDIARALAYSGQYDMNNPEDVEQIREKASSSARWYSLIRGVTQWAAPTGMSLRYDVKTAGEDGRWWGMTLLGDEYEKAVERFNGDETQALSWFIGAFGLNPIELVTSKTRSVTPHHLSIEGSAWARSEAGAEIMADYPATGYFVSPDETEDEFSWDAWNHSLATGAREIRTVEQWSKAANDTKGRLIYEAQRKKLEEAGILNKAPGRSYMRDLRNWLIETYDGYKQEAIGEGTRASKDDQIRELRRMVDDPRLTEYPAVQGLSLLFQQWDQISEAYVAATGGAPDGWLQSDSGAPLRAHIRKLAEWLMEQEQYSGFNSVWSTVFKRLVEEENLSPIDMSILGL